MSKSTFQYDKNGRLVDVQTDTGAKASFSYDSVGNRLTAVELAATITPPPPSPVVLGLPKKTFGDFKNTAMVVLTADGQLVGWGDNATGANGNGVLTPTNSPPQKLVFDPFTAVPPIGATIIDWVFNNANIYVVYSNGWVYSAGDNSYGQLGNGPNTSSRATLKRIEFFFTSGLSVTKVWAAGGSTTTACGGSVYFQTSDGNMYACGLNTAGQLGNASTPTGNLNSPAPCNGITNAGKRVVDVVTACTNTFISTYMLFNDNTLMVAGYNIQGQLGIGSNVNQTGMFVPAKMGAATVTTAVSISANGGSTAFGNALIVDLSGDVWTTGYNGHGELGQGNLTALNTFTKVAALSNIKTAELGGGASGYGYALSNTNTLYTWGYNGQNNLFRNNSTTPQSTPAAISGGVLPGAIKKVYFPRTAQGLATTAQLIVLTTNGKLFYCGAEDGQLGFTSGNGFYNNIASLQEILDSDDSIADLFIHGAALLQRWFVVTANGKLYGCGDNTDFICYGGRGTASPAGNRGNVSWTPIALV